MSDKEKIPIIRGIGWGDLVIGTTKEKVDIFLGDNGTITDKYDDCYFVCYTKYGILINFFITDNRVDTIFFYNRDEGYEHLDGFPVRTKENIGWDSRPFHVMEVYGKPFEVHRGIKNNISWQRIVYNGIDFRFLNKKLVRISITD